MSTTNYLLRARAVTITAFLTIFSRTQSTVPYILSLFFFNSGPLSSVELSISRHCPYYCLLWSDYDFIFIHHHVDEPE
jgi:hypothetical protein